MDFALSHAQQALIDKAATVARESMAPRAEMYDRAGVYPRESWHDLWRHGFLAIAVPTAYGGMGLDMPSYVMVLEQLAQGCYCASPAVTLAALASETKRLRLGTGVVVLPLNHPLRVAEDCWPPAEDHDAP